MVIKAGYTQEKFSVEHERKHYVVFRFENRQNGNIVYDVKDTSKVFGRLSPKKLLFRTIINAVEFRKVVV